MHKCISSYENQLGGDELISSDEVGDATDVKGISYLNYADRNTQRPTIFREDLCNLIKI